MSPLNVTNRKQMNAQSVFGGVGSLSWTKKETGALNGVLLHILVFHTPSIVASVHGPKTELGRDLYEARVPCRSSCLKSSTTYPLILQR